MSHGYDYSMLKKMYEEDLYFREYFDFLTKLLKGAFSPTAGMKISLRPTTKENDDMGNAADYLGHIKPPRPSCNRCNDTTRIIVGVYEDDDTPVTTDCSCLAKVGKEDPRG